MYNRPRWATRSFRFAAFPGMAQGVGDGVAADFVSVDVCFLCFADFFLRFSLRDSGHRLSPINFGGRERRRTEWVSFTSSVPRFHCLPALRRAAEMHWTCERTSPTREVQCSRGAPGAAGTGASSGVEEVLERGKVGGEEEAHRFVLTMERAAEHNPI
eukprot:gene26374-60147_t